jgi:rhomboid family protein
MLALWMFGTELERMWGSRFFTKFYFVCGIGAGLTTLLWAMSPLPFSAEMYYTTTIGASGAIYGVLLAYALYFPHRPIYLYFVFPIPARYFVMIIGAITFLSSIGAAGGGIAHTAHLGGLVVGYVYLKGLRGRPFDELKYRWLRWKMNRARGRFDVYSGGRRDDDDSWKSDWKKHIH